MNSCTRICILFDLIHGGFQQLRFGIAALDKSRCIPNRSSIGRRPRNHQWEILVRVVPDHSTWDHSSVHCNHCALWGDASRTNSTNPNAKTTTPTSQGTLPSHLLPIRFDVPSDQLRTGDRVLAHTFYPTNHLLSSQIDGSDLHWWEDTACLWLVVARM